MILVPHAVPVPSSAAPRPHAGAASATERGLVHRTADVLEVLRSAVGPMRLTDVAQAAALAKSTTHRILNALVDHGAVTRAGREYRLTLRSPGAPARVEPHGVDPALADFLDRLAQSTGCDAGFAVLDGPFALATWRRASGQAPPAAVRLRHLAHVSAAGIVLLAQEHRELGAYGRELGLPRAAIPVTEAELRRVRVLRMARRHHGTRHVTEVAVGARHRDGRPAAVALAARAVHADDVRRLRLAAREARRFVDGYV